MPPTNGDDFVIETPLMRLYYPKPRSYRYNIKGSNSRLVKLEKASDKSIKGATNLNKRETRILQVVLESLRAEEEAWAGVMAVKRQKVILEDRQRQIAHKALQNSLKQGFLSLNQFQHSGFRTKVVADIEKELSPQKLKKRRLEKLSKGSLAESVALCERNSAIMKNPATLRSTTLSNPKEQKRNYLMPIKENMSVSSPTINIPTAESRSVSYFQQSGEAARTPANTTLISKLQATPNLSFSFSEDDYDEGGFTPRPQPVSNENVFNKLPKVPCIGKE